MSQDKTQAKKDKNCRDFKAWQYGHELNQSLHIWSKEYDDVKTAKWLADVQECTRDSVIQVMEAFRKYGSMEKIRRYEVAFYYIDKAVYTLELGDALGWWQSGDLLDKYEEYAKIIRATLLHFVKKDGQSDEKKSAPETTIV